MGNIWLLCNTPRGMHGIGLLLWINGICQPKICIFSSVLRGVSTQHTHVLTTHFLNDLTPGERCTPASLFCLNHPSTERNCSFICSHKKKKKAVHQQAFLLCALLRLPTLLSFLLLPAGAAWLECGWEVPPDLSPCWRCPEPVAAEGSQ